jgi:hypothetical protein
MWINWRGDLEWSDGTPANLAPYDQGHLATHRDVSSPLQWLDKIGDSHVAVDAKTGLILGCENEDYPHIRNVAKQAPVYLHLFHGRIPGKAELDGWGFNGPTIGPLDYVHCTYMCDVKFGFQDGHDAIPFGLGQEGHLNIVGDCVEFDGKLYGDWSVSNHRATGLYEIRDSGRGTERLELTLHEALKLFQAEGSGQLVDISGDGAFDVIEGKYLG